VSAENFLYLASIWVLPVLLAVTFHEAAHAWAAWRLGDNTAHELGRVTTNPFRHVDPVGTVLIPVLLLVTRAPFLIGWAKPVPVNEAALGHPARDGMLVAAAGPAANLLIALICALLLRATFLLPDSMSHWALLNLLNAMWLNLVLAFFNILPVLPLDGGRVVLGLLPPDAAAVYSRHQSFGFMILIGLLFVLPELGKGLGMDLDLVRLVIQVPVGIFQDGLMAISGLTQHSGV
jgi:Zn-dependent protease